MTDTALVGGICVDIRKSMSRFADAYAKDAPITESRGYASDDAAEAVGGQFIGTTTGNVWLVGIQANYRF